MVHCNACITYSTTTNVVKYRDTERGSGNWDETRSITNRRKCCWNESKSGGASQYNAATVIHQKGQGGS